MIGILLVIVLSIIPLGWWWPYANLSSLAGILLSAGQATALVGITLLSLNFVLAARYYWVERMFKGLNKVYVFHHLVGAVSFSLLLLHPAGVLLGYALVSIGLATSTITPSWQNIPVFTGSLALLVMTILLVITFFTKLPYDVWKKTHQYLGMTLILAGIHGLLIGSTLGQNLFLKIYVLGWVVIGLISALIRLFNVRLNFHQYDYTVSELTVVKNWIIIKLKAESKPLGFLPGQFIFVKFESLGVTSESHPFSIAGKGGDGFVTIVVKSLGGYTETLKLLKNGAKAKIEGPYGEFSYAKARNKRQIWIAGGVGITPFRGMAYEVVEKGAYDINMFYVVNKPEEALFDQEFKTLAEGTNSFHYSLWIADEKGRITAEKIKTMAGELTKTDLFICGPVPMMKSMAKQFNQLGVKNSRIHTEEFELY